MCSVFIFLKNIGTTINVSIWSLHIFLSVHPWQKLFDQIPKLFAKQKVSTLSIDYFEMYLLDGKLYVVQCTWGYNF